LVFSNQSKLPENSKQATIKAWDGKGMSNLKSQTIKNNIK
jgi:hypothetical protein